MMRRRETIHAFLLAPAMLCLAPPLHAQSRTYRLALLAPADFALDVMREALPELQKLG